MNAKKKSKSNRAKQLVATAASGAASAAASLLTGTPAGGALVRGSTAAASPLVSYFWDHGDRARQRRQEKLLAGFAQEGGDAEAARLLLKLHDEDWANDAVAETIRKMLDAISDEVVPVLGRLLHEYLAGEKRVDWYFRGVSRVLCEMTTDEFAHVKAMLAYVASKELPEYAEVVILTVGPAGNAPDLVRVHNLDMGENGIDLPSARRLFRLLKANDLADEDDADDHAIKLRREMIGRLLVLMTE